MKPTEQIFLRVDKPTMNKLKIEAEKKGLKWGQTARLIIMDYLNNNSPRKKIQT